MLHVGKPCLYCPGKARLSQDCTTFLSCSVLCCHSSGLSSPRKEKIPSTTFFFSCASNCHVLSLSLLLNVGQRFGRSVIQKRSCPHFLLLGFEVKVASPFPASLRSCGSSVVGANIRRRRRNQSRLMSMSATITASAPTETSFLTGERILLMVRERALRPVLIYVRWMVC